MIRRSRRLSLGFNCLPSVALPMLPLAARTSLARAMSSSSTPKLQFHGVYTALVTPFTSDGSAVDLVALRRIVERQIAAGVDGLVPMGSTGENTLVSAEERLEVIAKVVQWTDKRVPVIAGTGSHSTEHAVQLATEAKRAGADACLVIPPYYARPSQRGIYEHYKAVAEVGLPVMIYNNPSRAGVTVEPETIAELFKLPGIVALKDATPSLDNVVRVLALCDINVISGSDNMALPMMSIGATGVMSILSNAAPERVLAITKAVQRGDYTAAREAHQKNVLLVDSLFVEPNPQPIKKVMELLGHCSGVVRRPLTECSAETGKLLEQQLRENGLL